MSLMNIGIKTMRIDYITLTGLRAVAQTESQLDMIVKDPSPLDTFTIRGNGALCSIGIAASISDATPKTLVA
jgi:hypothetical protein